MTQNSSTEPELQVMVWYREKDWKKLKKLFSDSHLLPPKYKTWLKMAEKAVKDIEASGDLVAKVTIDTEIFPKWCREKGCQMDAEARTTFAIETIQKQQFLNNM